MNSQHLIDYYRRMAPLYDRTRFPWMGGPLGILEKEEIKRVVKHGLVLECGIGSGRHPLTLGINDHFIGCDISKNMLLECKKNMNFSSAKVDVILADAQKLPLRGNLFDSVICSRAIKFFNEPEHFVSEVKRCLNKGGKCVISTGSRDSLFFRIAVRLRIITPNNEKEATLERYYFKKQFQQFLEREHFVAIQVIPVGNIFFGLYSFVWFNLCKTPFASLIKRLPLRLTSSLLRWGRTYHNTFALIIGEK